MSRLKLFFVSTALSACVLSQAATAETLASAVQDATTQHPSILAAHAAEQAMRSSINEERAALYPTVNLGASFGRLYSNSTTTRGLSVSRGIGYSWVGDANATINQRLYDFGGTQDSISAAKNRAYSAETTTQAQMSSLELQAVQVYLQLLRASTLLDAATVNKANMDDYYNRISVAYDNGGADESEVSRAQDLVSLAKNAVAQFESDHQIAEASFKEVVGRLPDGDILEPSLDMSHLPDTLEEAIAVALSKNHQLLGAVYEIEANRDDLSREETAILPTLDAELSALKRDQDDLVGGEVEDARALVRASWDYSFGGAVEAAKNRASALVKEAEYNKEALRRTIERDVEVAWVSLNLASQQKTNEQDRLDAAKQTLETYSEQYEGGQQKMLDVMGGESAAFLAEQAYLNAKYQEMNAAYTIMNLIGLPVVADVPEEVVREE